MGDQSFPARYTTSVNMLNTTTTNLFQQYMAIQAASTSLSSQNGDLQAEVTSLNAKLANVKKAGDTYEREFLDRSATPEKRGIFNRNGITTLQDWLLFMFFILYGIICLSVIIYTIRMSREKLYAGIMVFTITFVLGIMIAAIVVRFA